MAQPVPPSDYCFDPEGLGPVSRLRDLDLTPCFEHTVQSGLLLIFVVFAAVRCVQLGKRETRAEGEDGKRLLSAKIAIGVAPLVALSCASLVISLVQRGESRVASAPVISTAVALVASVLVGLLTYLNHTRARRSSTLLLTLWPIYLLEQAIALRTQVLIGHTHNVRFALDCALLGAGFASWTFECFCPDRTKEDPDAEPEEKELPYERANVYSRLTFGWMTPLMKLGYSRYITERDMSALSPGDTAHALSETLSSHWNQQLRSKNPSLWGALLRSYGRPYAVAALIKTVRDVLSFAEPQLLRFLLAFIAAYQSGDQAWGKSAFIGWAIAGAMFLLSVVQTAMLHQYFQICFVTGMRVRAGLVTAIYNKALVQAADSQGSRGDIVNLMSVDASRMQDLCTYGLIAFSGPLQITLAFPLTADVIFPCISLFNLLQFPLAMFASITSQLVEASVAVTRIRKFLLSDELQPDARSVDEGEVAEGDTVLGIQNGDFKWSQTLLEPTLQHIDLTVRKGELIGVLGRVGAGKTSLLSAIVGEMIREEGTVKVMGKIAYAPQNAWIMNATIRENILFSHRYDEEFYNVVLDACALRPDLALFSDGDLTEVGEKGITLSGGQRARISLARTVYARADLYLLDDPLAAVDAHVARHVFDQVIGPNGLLAGKARLHVTNSVAYLDQHDSIMMLRRGIVLESGTFTEIMSDPTKELAKLIASNKKSNQGSRTQSGTATPINPSSEMQESRTSDETLAPSLPSPSREKPAPKKLRRPTIMSVRSQQRLRAQLQAQAGAEQKVEHREQGNVKMGVYKRYFQASSVPGVIVYMLCMVLQQACSILSNVSLKSWGNHNQEAGDNTGVGYYLFIYGMFALGSALFSFVASVLLWVFCAIKSARSLHDAMLLAVIRAPLSFFEQTPLGRIMNLFSRDQYVIDEVLIRVFGGFFRTMLVVTGIVVVVGGTFPLFLVTLIPLAYVYRVIMLYYLATSRELKRLDATSKSPIFAWFQESLGGLSTIRAFGQQDVFMAQNEAKLDRNQMVYLPAVSVNRWLAIRLELLGAFIVLSAAVLSLVALVTTGVDAGLVGLVLSYGLSTTQSLNWVVRSASEVEQNLVSVERVVGYINLEPEAPLEIPDAGVPVGWPESGEIVFKDYCMRYRPEIPLVLKDLNMTI
ncbi:hypothetical protein FS749_003298, partial [Ceratobasidium sp. UAMH 11750]